MRFILLITATIICSSIKAQDCASLQSDIATGILSGSYTISTTCTASHSSNVLLSGSIRVVEGGNLTIDVTGGDRILNMIDLGTPPSIVVEGDGMGMDDGVLSVNLDLGAEGALTVQNGAVLNVGRTLVAGTAEPTLLDINGTLTAADDFEAHDNLSISGTGLIDVEGAIVEVDGIGTVNESGFTGTYECTSGCTSGSLPVELISFTGYYEDGMVHLEWTTATELDNKGFYIERSLDGMNFSVVGFVEGQGTSSVINSYYFNEWTNLGNNLVFYRLRQVDFDGTSTNSETIAITLEGEAVSLFPTLVESEVTLLGSESLTYDVILYDLRGGYTIQEVCYLSKMPTKT